MKRKQRPDIEYSRTESNTYTLSTPLICPLPPNTYTLSTPFIRPLPPNATPSSYQGRSHMHRGLPLIRKVIPINDHPLIRPDFRCIEVPSPYKESPSHQRSSSYQTIPSPKRDHYTYKANFQFQKEWFYKGGTTVRGVNGSMIEWWVGMCRRNRTQMIFRKDR